MSTTPVPVDLQRWSDELARNPASLAFLPLARAYRRQGQLEQATRLCLRGLEQHATHVEAHALLALLYLETGDRAKAADEWSTVLRLKPGNFEALRGMGFRYLEQGDIARAKQHLERAALIRPTDTAVQEALRLLRSHTEVGRSGAREGNGGVAAVAAPAGVAAVQTEERAGILELVDEEVVAPAVTTGVGDDPALLFEALLTGGRVVGALLLDARGLVLAGRLTGEASGRAEEVGAVMGGTVEEVARAVVHLELSAWRGMLLECGSALLHVAPVGADALLVLAVRRDSPRGWVLRVAQRAAGLAERYLGTDA